MAEMLVPPWLEPLLNTAFFSVCRIHGDAARSECNMYCLDCNKDAFCFYCRSTRHNDHQVIQIRRSSYHDVVRVSEIENVLDISGVQTYVINSARVLFLNERPQPKSGKSVSHICEICGRTLLDPFRFCSLGCKLVGIKTNGNARFSLEGNNVGQLAERSRGEGMSSRRLSSSSSSSSSSSRRGEKALLEGSQQQDTFPPAAATAAPPPPQPSARRRKGIPHRAPFKA
ncbi:protein RGF1 INDUCIBLE TRANSCRIPTION FACTOR 1-like isoform X2 [Diospyros lotus]|uniref:protein RGF1 INDUCIBLE TRANSCRIPTION FACTOR 1-like isoform X2 n=1 Tax=Diospyros lotus TaxID=55363 RepID=UPI00224C93D7|nr:protein RGF1 INDUCIBLE TRANSCRIPTION FACTOR 1-like isoform X2 [Diospyros lotus]